MRELDVVRYWLELVRKKNQWPHYGDWTNHQFQLLSDEISDRSGIKIDRNTIRKIVESVNIGKPYSPHLSTKDALARYIGEKNWHQFAKKLINPKKNNKRTLFAAISIIAVLILIPFLLLILLYKSDMKFDFSVENAEGIIPHTIQCTYNFEDLKTEEIYIDYGHVNPDGNYILQKIDKNSMINRHCFHFPGSYNIRLFIDGEVRADEKVWINSRDWFIYAADAASYISKNEVPEILKKAGLPILQQIPFNSILDKQTTDNGYLYIPQEKIMAIEGQTTNYHLHLKNFKHFGADMQSSEFSIRFKDDDFGEGINCSEAAVYLFCEQGIVGFKFAQKGCERYTHLRIGNDFKAGRDANLDFLIVDYKQFTTLSVRGESDRIILLLNDEEVKSFSTQQKFGEIRGMHFWFKGSPYIDFVRLTSNEGNLIYADEFD